VRKIISYNVNGIRSAMNKGLIDWLAIEKPDIICFQELKANKEQVELEAIEALGYHHYWHSAEKKGYSGVAIFSLDKPVHVEIGMGNELYDREGRVIRADFKEYSVISVYHPSGSSGDERQAFKMEWLDAFYNYIEELQKEYPKLIICGDYNICHQPIDIHNPVSNKNSSGFLPEEREWLSKFIDLGYIDSFRKFHSEPHQYSWWSFRMKARDRNLGWRIDYNMVSKSLESHLKDASILQEVKHSDHCPVVVEMN
jgi:exodeoxyribonuclease III